VGLVFVFCSVILDRTGTISFVGNYLKSHHGPDIVIFIIFVISGMIVNVNEIKSGIKDIPSTVVAIITILVISPLAAGLLSLFPLEKGLIIGLFIVAAMPTTLSSGVVMTGKAGGNIAHALFITIFSNSISIFSIPFVLSMLLSFSFRSQYIAIDHIAIMTRLFLLVMLPLTIGLINKKFFIKMKADTKIKMQVINQILVIGIVFMAASSTAEMFNNNISQIFLIVFFVSIFHVILLLFSFFSTRLLKIGKGRFESVIFMGSQKTLPLAIIIQLTYFTDYDSALLVCVIHHFVHLMIDGYLCTRIKYKTR